MQRRALWIGYGGEFRIEERPVRQPGDDEVLVDIAYVGICASDLHISETGYPGVGPPAMLGHEASGVVEAVGAKITTLRKGDRVAIQPHAPCGTCYYCRDGLENFCEGTGRMGFFAEYAVLKPANLHRLPDGVSLKEGALVEPLTIAVQGHKRADIRPGNAVLIHGGGSIGMLFVQLARLSGANPIIVSEPIAFKRELALKLAADRVVDPISEDLRRDHP